MNVIQVHYIYECGFSNSFNVCSNLKAAIFTLLANFSIGMILTAATKTVPNEIGGEFAGQIYAFSVVSKIGRSFMVA